MADKIYKLRAPDGNIIEVTGPEDATDEELEQAALQLWKPAKGAAAARGVIEAPPSNPDSGLLSGIAREARRSLPYAIARGVKDTLDTGAELLAPGDAGQALERENTAAKAAYDAENKGDWVNTGGRLVGNMIGAAPALKVLGAGAKAAHLPGLGAAIETAGMSTGQAVRGALGTVKDLATRTLGGTVAGATGAGLADPETVLPGAGAGGLLPGALASVGYAGRTIAGLAKPFFGAGQDRIIADFLKDLLPNPASVAAVMERFNALGGQKTTPLKVPPHTAAVTGSEELAGLNRTLQSASPEYAAELDRLASMQNARRTNVLGDIAGNPTKISAAEKARDAIATPAREAVLKAAKPIDGVELQTYMEVMKKKPDNQGELAQAVINKFQKSFAGITNDTGKIDAVSLYEIRKDVNQIMQGKLQGEAGNLRYARGQLKEVKNVIDDVIEASATRKNASQTPWKDYLKQYADDTVPINQMKMLEEVQTAIGTGSVDKYGNPFLSTAKLNNYLRTHEKELRKELSPKQYGILEDLASDLNANTRALTAGKAIGSNTVQNLSQDAFWSSVLGEAVSKTAPVRSGVGNVMKPLYIRANKDIVGKMGQLMLDPTEGGRLLRLAASRKVPAKPSRVIGPLEAVTYRAGPLAVTDQ